MIVKANAISNITKSAVEKQVYSIILRW